MKTHRTVIALLVFVALVMPQTTPVQSAPLNVESMINLHPGDTITAFCPTALIPKATSPMRLKVLCSYIKIKNGIATPTPIPTSTATTTPESPTTQPLALTIKMRPGDIVTVTCPTRLIPKYALRKSGKVLCQSVVVHSTITATPTQAPDTTPIATHTLTNTPTHSHDNATATQTFTNTPTLLPNITATITQTSTPSRTPTAPSGGNIQPYAGAPECPTHNGIKWHSLWDSVRGCHYNHTHGDDPSLGDKYFGPAGVLWGGQTISYPFSTGESENTHKHAGYKWSVKSPEHNPWPLCGVNSHTDNSPGQNNCVVASRVQYHITAGMDAYFRYHSYYLELYICSKANNYAITSSNCGIMKIGGWADYGDLHVPHYGDRVVRPGGTVDFGGGHVMQVSADGPDLPPRSVEPYVYMRPSANLNQYLSNSPRLGHTMEQWSMNDLDCEPRPAGDPCHNRYARILAQVNDSWLLINPNDVNKPVFICRDGSCDYNGSLIGVEEIAAEIMQSWQQGGNGFVTLTGWTDRWGNPRFDGQCAAVSVDCVPLVLDHAPVGVAASRSDTACLCTHEIEYDISPPGENWIEFPN